MCWVKRVRQRDALFEGRARYYGFQLSDTKCTSVLLQYSRPFEVLMGRRRTTYMVADGLVHGPDGGDGLVHQDRFV